MTRRSTPDNAGAPGFSHHRRLLPALVGIRFFAALGVFLFHSGHGFAERLHAPEFVLRFLLNGFVGVGLFFVLSGFILTYNYADGLRTPKAIRQYALARFARVYPVYFLLLLLALPLVWGTLNIGTHVSVLLMVQSWTLPASSLGDAWIMQAWTLSVEFFFYLMFPALLPLLRRLDTRMTFAGAVIAGAVVLLCCTPTIVPGQRDLAFGWLAYVPIPVSRLAEFTYGMILAQLMLRDHNLIERIARPWIANLLCLVVLGILASSNDKHGVSFAVVTAGLFFVAAARQDTGVASVLSRRPIVFLGAASYSFYLAEGPVREWVRVANNGIYGQLLNPALTLAAAVVIFKFWEEPWRKLIRRKTDSKKPNLMPREAPASREVLCEASPAERG